MSENEDEYAKKFIIGTIKYFAILIIGIIITFIISIFSSRLAIVTIKQHGHVSSWGFEMMGVVGIAFFAAVLGFPLCYSVSRLMFSGMNNNDERKDPLNCIILGIIIPVVISFIISLVI